jgi:hypothetical protein
LKTPTAEERLGVGEAYLLGERKDRLFFNLKECFTNLMDKEILEAKRSVSKKFDKLVKQDKIRDKSCDKYEHQAKKAKKHGKKK